MSDNNTVNKIIKPTTIFDNTDDMKPRVEYTQSDFGHFAVIHPVNCELRLREIPALTRQDHESRRTWDWEVRCMYHLDGIVFADYIDWGFDWLFCLHQTNRVKFRRELIDQNLVVPSTWYLDEWLNNRLLMYSRFFNKKPVFIMVY